MNTPISRTSPLHQNGTLGDLDAVIDKINHLANALSGIGALMYPEHTRADEQLNMALRSEAAAVFKFFGGVLSEYRVIATCAHNALEQEAFSAASQAQGGQHE